jgi:lysyl-tRNA synthetase class II
VLFTITCSASESITKINDLIENSVVLNNTQVTVQSEVIGEALERGEYAWININDTTNAIGVWVKKSDIKQIKFYGDYKHKGDIVKVTGVFYRACSEHGGDVDIHSTNIEIVETGSNTKHQLSQNKVIVTFCLVLIAVVMLVFYFRLKGSK